MFNADDHFLKDPSIHLVLIVEEIFEKQHNWNIQEN